MRFGAQFYLAPVRGAAGSGQQRNGAHGAWRFRGQPACPAFCGASLAQGRGCIPVPLRSCTHAIQVTAPDRTLLTSMLKPGQQLAPGPVRSARGKAAPLHPQAPLPQRCRRHPGGRGRSDRAGRGELPARGPDRRRLVAGFRRCVDPGLCGRGRGGSGADVAGARRSQKCQTFQSARHARHARRGKLPPLSPAAAQAPRPLAGRLRITRSSVPAGLSELIVVNGGRSRQHIGIAVGQSSPPGTGSAFRPRMASAARG